MSATSGSSGVDRTVSLGGFVPDRFVAGSFNDNLLCSICRYVFDSPVLTPCGHLFCASCLSHWLTACQTLLPSCPECRRTVFAFDVRPVRGLRNYIASLPTYCSLRRHGCNTVLPLEQIQAHEDVCTHKSPPSSLPSSSESSPNSNSAANRNSRTNRAKPPPVSNSNNNQQRNSRVTTRSQASSNNGSLPNSPSSSTVVRNRASTVSSSTANSRPSNTRPTAVIDHRPNARQRIALANQLHPALANHPPSLNDRVARLEEKLQQVRLDIEAAEQRNVWLETQLALARNNLSLADALRRVRATPGGPSSSGSQAGSTINRRRPATHSLSQSDD